jgi:predicted nucleotidyltransferase
MKKTYTELKEEMLLLEKQMKEAQKEERKKALKAVKFLCKEHGITCAMLKGSVAKGRAKAN